MPSLFLHTDDPLWRPRPPGELVALLGELGLLDGEAGCHGPDRYPAGHCFLQLLMFLGCSPRVSLAPGDGESGDAVCSVRLLAFEEPVFLSARPLPSVRCSQCRARASLPPEFTFSTQYRCSACGAATRAVDLDWRQGAGYGRFFLEVNGIYPHEAMPSDKLLAELSRFARCGWKYFFADVSS